MAINFTDFVNQTMPLIKVGVILLIIIIILFGLLYYFLVIARRKKWYCRIWEVKADGKKHLIGEDILTRKLLDFGKKMIYQFKKTKYYVSFPPTEDTTYKCGNKEFVDYLRMGMSHFPLKHDKEAEFKKHSDEIKAMLEKTHYVSFIDRVKSHDLFYKFFKKTKSTKNKEIYICNYIPIKRDLVINSTYVPMQYDLDMMRQASIDVREQMYKQRESFWDKYKEPIIWGILILSILMVAYISFEYMKEVMKMNINLCSNLINNVTSYGNPPKV